MAPWAIALIFVAVLAGVGWLSDHLARRRRRGLERLTGPGRHEDRVAEVERLAGGTTSHATGDQMYTGNP